MTFCTKTKLNCDYCNHDEPEHQAKLLPTKHDVPKQRYYS